MPRTTNKTREDDELDEIPIPPDLPDDPAEAYVEGFRRGRSLGWHEAAESSWKRL